MARHWPPVSAGGLCMSANGPFDLAELARDGHDGAGGMTGAHK
jgi:hypothetical protein